MTKRTLTNEDFDALDRLRAQIDEIETALARSGDVAGACIALTITAGKLRDRHRRVGTLRERS